MRSAAKYFLLVLIVHSVESLLLTFHKGNSAQNTLVGDQYCIQKITKFWLINMTVLKWWFLQSALLRWPEIL